MRYEIRRFRNGVPDYEAEFWPDTPLADVVDYARRLVGEGDADRVSVHDGSGGLVMNIPRTLRRA